MQASLEDGDLVEKEQRDAIISIIKNDSYLADFCTYTNQMDKTTYQEISTIPIPWKVINNNPEISVFNPTDIDYKEVGSYINSKNVIYIHVAYQNQDPSVALDSCYELTKSIRSTLRQKLNLNRTCGGHLVKSIKPLGFDNAKGLWTYILEMTIEIKQNNYVN